MANKRTNRVAKNVYLDISLVTKTEIYLTRPGTNAPAHGSWSSLIERLLRSHLKQLPNKTKNRIETIHNAQQTDLLNSIGE